MTIDDWIKAGYSKHYKDIVFHKYAECLLQKRVRDEAGITLYFINVHPYSNMQLPRSFMASCQMYRGEDTVDIELHKTTGPEHVEAFFADVFKSLRMDADHHNND